ncbi:MAG TPA: patatin-like phospholipase family protein, partial [Alphaproteobacteria bacterium]|nr:patatin-like phospholipase family protein [Alphaproteobacteria bacterium]
MGFFKKFTQAQTPSQNRDIGLALAGGGSWGAFTWGALTALIEKGIITEDNLKAVSGTSAGAANAA